MLSSTTTVACGMVSEIVVCTKMVRANDLSRQVWAEYMQECSLIGGLHWC